MCLDNFFTGSRENIAHLLGKPNFELVRHDLSQPIFLEVDEKDRCRRSVGRCQGKDRGQMTDDRGQRVKAGRMARRS